MVNVKLPKTVKLKTYVATTLVLAVLLLASVGYVLTSNGTTVTIIPPSYTETASYVIFEVGGTYYAKNGSTGEIGFSGTNATQVIEQSWNSMSSGGRIFIKGEITLSTGLVFKLTKYVTALEIVGEGETASTLEFEGSGYALTVTTDDTSVGHYYVKLEGFTIDCVSKTTGRHGLKIEKVGRNAYVENLYVNKADIGIHIYDTNIVYIDRCKIVNVNFGIKTEKGATSSPNAVYIDGAKVDSATQYGIYLKGGNSISAKKIVVENCGTGVWIRDCWAVDVSGYFEGNSNVDINVAGTDNSYPAKVVNIHDSYFASTCDYAINVTYARKVHVSNIKSKNHNTAFLWYHNTLQELILENIDFDDPYFLDGSPTQYSSRLAGIVIQPSFVGIIAMAANTVHEGTVVYWSAGGVVANTTSVNQTTPMVVVYGQQTDKPCVVATSGIVKVYVKTEVTVSVGDALISSDVSGQAQTSSDGTLPMYLIGYAVQPSTGGELIYCRVLG
ncbi:hypothetical protein DRO45_00115 [Candidatus Bathyarchaeota archaeon]|nr:MAG: hypothetical protein DRO45_00115 [Candidatus Bathyarchaeota archaeon]